MDAADVRGHWFLAMLAQGKPSTRWAKSELIPFKGLKAGVWYRTPFYSDDHLLDPETEYDALCGRILDPIEWEGLVFQAEMNGVDVGPSPVYLSERKGNKCSGCKTAAKALAPAETERPKRVVDRVEAARFVSKVTMVKRLLHATEEREAA